MLVPQAPEGVKRGEEKQRKKTEHWERAARSGAVCTGLDASSACLFLPHKHFCQNESQTAEHTAHTHTCCFCRSRMHSPILKCFPVAPFLFHLLPVSPRVTSRPGTPPSSDGWWPCSGLGDSQSPSERQDWSPASPAPTLPVLAGLTALGEPDGNKPRVPRPPARCAAGAKAWERACAGVWLLSWAGKKTAPSSGCSLFPMDGPQALPVGLRGAKPCARVHSVLVFSLRC